MIWRDDRPDKTVVTQRVKPETVAYDVIQCSQPTDTCDDPFFIHIKHVLHLGGKGFIGQVGGALDCVDTRLIRGKGEQSYGICVEETRRIHKDLLERLKEWREEHAYIVHRH